MKKELLLLLLAKVIPQMTEAGKAVMSEALEKAWDAVQDTPTAFDNIAVALAMDLFDCTPEDLSEDQLWAMVQGACNDTPGKLDNFIYRLAKGLAGN